MSALAILERDELSLFDAEAPEPTLDAMISRAWTRVTAHGSAECPVCGEAMRPRYSAHALPVGGRCGGCGSELS